MGELKQLSIFAENKPGRLEKITRALAEGGVNILAVSISSSVDFGVIKFIVDKTEEASQILRDNGFTLSLNPVLAIELVDAPGGLHRVALILYKCNVNIENAHVFVAGSRDKAYLIVEVEDVEEAKAKLSGEDLRYY